MRARLAVLVVVGLRASEEHCVGGRLLSFGARPWCDVPDAASNATRLPREKQAHARRRAVARCLLEGGAKLEPAAHAQRAALEVVGLGASEERRTGGGALLFRRAAVVRHVSYRLKLEAGCRVRSKRTRAGARSLSGGGAVLEVPRARFVAPVVVGLNPIKKRCTGERLLSFGARPWCDVLAAASNAKPAAA